MSDQPSPGVLGPLHGLRILDLTHHIAGPYCTKLLADYGAEVIKVERPPDGDALRRWQPAGALFTYLNANKASVMLDLKRPEGREALLGVAMRCDAVVENFMPDVLERLRLDYDTLRAVNPTIVLTSISNFGRHGPFRSYEATELTVFAFGGRMSASGVKPRPPVRLLGGSSEFMAGTVAAGATLIALRTGQADHIDVSIANVILGEPDRALCLTAYSGVDIERPDAPRPFQVFPGADGWVVMNLNRGIERVAEMIGMPELAEDPRFANNLARQQNAAELEGLIIAWTAVRTKAEIVAEARRFRVIASPVNTIPEVLASSHLRERAYFRTAQARDGRSFTVPGPPFRIHTLPDGGWSLRDAAPRPGQDTVQVLASLGGLSRSAIDTLIADRVAVAEMAEQWSTR
jgi:crotonobetainyl-CoA:carnitine CoA-transferase CaiB-like acyl-CoA transferase